MKSHQIALFGFITFIFYGCNTNRGSINYDKFPIEKNVELLEINLTDTFYMHYPKKIAMADSLFFILDLSAKEYFVQCYSYPSFEHICSLFKKGQGDGEAVSINNIQCMNDTLFAYDATNTVYSVEMKTIHSENIPIGKHKLPGDFGFLNKGMRIGNDYYFPTFTQLNNGRIIKFENNGKTVLLFGNINKEDNSELSAATYQAWLPYLGGNDSILVAATQFGEVIDIFYLGNNNMQRTIKGQCGDPVFQEFNSYAINKGIMGFWDVAVTSKYIFALFDGTKVAEQTMDKQGGRIVYVFDYNGNPQLKLNLNRQASSLYLDEKGERIYFLDVNSDMPLYYIALPEYLINN